MWQAAIDKCIFVGEQCNSLLVGILVSWRYWPCCLDETIFAERESDITACYVFIQGAFVFREQMIDKPSLLQAENIKTMADLIKVRTS